MSNRQARLIGLAIVALAGAILSTGREADAGLIILGVSLLGFLIQFMFTFRSERVEEDDFAAVCETCGYDLTGNVSGVCPECGTPVSGRPIGHDLDDDSDDDSDDAIDDDREDDENPPADKGAFRPNRD